MPAPVLKSFAKKSGKSIETLEKYWNEAKTSAREKGLEPGSDRFFAFVTAIVKRRAGLSESLEEFWGWILDTVLNEYDLMEQDEDGEEDEEGGEEEQKPDGETLIQQFARKKGKSEFQIEQIWTKIKEQAKAWQEKKRVDDEQMLDFALELFHEAMDKMKNVEVVEPEEEKPDKEFMKLSPKEEKEKGTPPKPKDDDASVDKAATNRDEEEEKDKEKESKKDDKEHKEDRKERDKQDEENEEDTEEKIEKRKEAAAKRRERIRRESMEKTELALETAAASQRVGGNVLSPLEKKMLKKVGIDTKGLSQQQVKKLIKQIQKRNKKRAKVQTSKGKGLGFLGNIFLGAVGFGAGFVGAKVLDKAFSVFGTGGKTTGAGF